MCYTQLNPEWVPLHVAPPRGRNYTNSSATIGDPRRNTWRGGYFSGSVGNSPGEVGRSTRDKGRSPEGVDKEVDTVKGPIHMIVWETGKFEETEVPIRAPPNGDSMYYDGATT